jgi:predicted RNA-binding protein YlqC (UPF0109 family)
MKNLLTFLLIHIVDHPDAVEIQEREDDFSTEYRLVVHQDDIGKVIGKNGRIIQAIRTIAKVRAMKEHRKIIIQLAEDPRE